MTTKINIAQVEGRGDAVLYDTGVVEGTIPLIGPGDLIPAALLPAAATPITTYTSAPTVFTTGASYSFTHGLGAAPFMFMVYLQCVSAELGYAVGDIVIPGHASSGGVNSDRGLSCYIDDSTPNKDIVVHISTFGPVIIEGVSHISSIVTPAKWKLLVKAFRA